MKHEQIAPSKERFKLILSRYVKHSGLEIELTLKNGEIVTISPQRKIEGDEIVQFLSNGEVRRIPLKDIRKAEIYAM
ncbi:MAG: hypothetical protein NZM25_07410 [Leptospiraceae bacterium]|nr:hypothetical protein [Leptospiraceae bacterium]MDW8307710.1 hypothetical protein [Leptospiraceae bacterium]